MLRAPRALLALSLLCALVFVTTPAAAGQANVLARKQALLRRSWPDDAVPGSVLVTARTEAGADDLTALEGGIRLGDRVVLLHVEPGTEADTAARLAGRGDVVATEPDVARSLAAVPDDPLFAEQWSHELANATTAWNETTGVAGVDVAIIDTGIDATHSDLRANVIDQVDVSSGRVVTRSVGIDNDSCEIGHGTFVAGVVGAVGGNGRGVAGVAWEVGLIDVAIMSPASRCGILDSAIVAALDYVADRSEPVDVANLSLGGVADACPTAVQVAVDDARDAGVVVVAAAGNAELRQPGATSVPASCNGVLSVASVGETGRVAGYSQQNPEVDLAAPGGDTSAGDGIVSTAIGGGYAEEEGTSFASPYIAGAAALLRSVDATLSPDDVEWFLESTADDRGSPGRDDGYGWGVVDVGAAVEAVAAGTAAEAPAADPPFPVNDLGMELDRIAPSDVPTKVAAQAAAMSRETFDVESAVHAVLARTDDFADALAGSALGFGVGPVLFTTPTGPMVNSTKTELQRAVQPGGTVYILGGTAALPATLEGELGALGFEPMRIAGTTRELTAVAAAEELERFLAESDFEQPAVALVANAYNWPDAVTAGSFGALFGMPVLVTATDALHPAVATFLSDRAWDRVYVVGGTAALSDATRAAIIAAAGLVSGDVPRLAGTTRNGTAVAVAEELEDTTQLNFGILPQEALAVNLRRIDGYAHVLSASARVGQRSGVFVPVEGDGGTEIPLEAQQYACRFPVDGVVVGGHDVISGETATLFDDVLRGSAPACSP